MFFFFSLQAQISVLKGGCEGSKQYRHNQQLEELRNLQDKLSVEKTAWAATRDAEAKELEEKRAELVRLQEQIRAEQSDITQQREQLYRKMEVLTSQGLLISPNVALPVPVSQEDSNKMENSEENNSVHSENSVVTSGNHTTERRKDKWNKSKTAKQNVVFVYLFCFVLLGTTSKSQLPINLISTTNQQKVSQNLPVKQQIPLKLVSRLSSGSSCSNTNTASVSGPQQMLPLKLSQDEKTRRSSSGYQRLSSDSFSPPSSEMVIVVLLLFQFDWHDYIIIFVLLDVSSKFNDAFAQSHWFQSGNDDYSCRSTTTTTTATATSAAIEPSCSYTYLSEIA